MNTTEQKSLTWPIKKHKGKDVSDVLAEDPSYVEWAMNQSWFKERYPAVYTLIVTGVSQQNTEETPEHNKLQAKFNSKEFRQHFRQHFLPEEKKFLDHIKQIGGKIKFDEILEFEVNGWDVFYSNITHLNYIYKEEVVEIELPVKLGEYWSEIYNEGRTYHSLYRGMEGRSEYYFDNLPAYKSLIASLPKKEILDSVPRGLHSSVTWVPKTDWYKFISELTVDGAKVKPDVVRYPEFNREVKVKFKFPIQLLLNYCGHFRTLVEIKPSLGDDFPVILRQMDGNWKLFKAFMKNSRNARETDKYYSSSPVHKTLLFRDYASELEIEDVKQMFKSKDITVVSFSDLGEC